MINDKNSMLDDKNNYLDDMDDAENKKESESDDEDEDETAEWIEIHKQALKDFKLCVDAEADNRNEALDDLKFARLGEQWPDDVIQKRKLEGRPCMTYNRMPTFIRKVVNDGRQNKPSIKVHPCDDSADTQTAEIINGIIRNIENSSNSEVAYDTALDFAASCGIGYLRVDVQYSHDDAFDLDIFIERISNPFTIYGDYRATSADSSDWNMAFVVDAIEEKEYKKRYGEKAKVSFDSDAYIGMPDEWRDGDKVIVAEYWVRKETQNEIAKLSDGRIVDVEWLNAEVDGLKGTTNKDALARYNVRVVSTRKAKSYEVCQYIMSGAEILEENDWAGKYIPIIPVYGEELNIEGKRHFRSLIRDAKDAQRNFNYWRTTTTEMVALAPKAPFIGAVGQFDTDADKWAAANAENAAYIEYDIVPGAPPPMRQGFAGVPAGALQEALNAADDMKSIIGIYDASLGARSNETSGRAINARRAESEVSTYHFIDNQARAIKHTGRIILDLIPHIYNKKRIVRVMGEDKKTQTVPVNQPQQQPDGTSQVYDLTVGKYDLTVNVGLGFQTKREEAAYGMTELVRSYPMAAPIIAPHLAEAQDWPGADKIAEELRMLSPQAQQGNPQVQQAEQAIQQLQAQLQQAQQVIQSMQTDKSLEAQKLEIDKFNAETNRLKTQKEMQPPMMDAQGDNVDEREKIALETESKVIIEKVKQEGQKELELLKQKAKIAKANTNQLLTVDENLNLVPSDVVLEIKQVIDALGNEMQNVKKRASAKRMLIRDESGRPSGSIIVDEFNNPIGED